MAGTKSRFFHLLRGLALLIALGLGYELVVRKLGWGLQCPFHAVTGLLCPGCGVSRMCLALLGGDWMGAWRANPGLVILAPVIMALLGLRAVRYVKTGEYGPLFAKEAGLWAGLALLLAVYGVLRNFRGLLG